MAADGTGMFVIYACWCLQYTLVLPIWVLQSTWLVQVTFREVCSLYVERCEYHAFSVVGRGKHH